VRAGESNVPSVSEGSPRVGVIMGSDSDLPTMQAAIDVLAEFGVGHEVRIVSAHRTPDVMADYARTAADRGIEVIIAGAGGAAHLPGMTASMTPLPVIGVPVPLAHLDGMDSLLSIVQMPKGIPVATVGVGNATNAGLLAVRILAATDRALRERMVQYQEGLAAMVLEKDARLPRS
jgi:5-(carboxyamino)imidazole ribonucleotide mutase